MSEHKNLIISNFVDLVLQILKIFIICIVMYILGSFIINQTRKDVNKVYLLTIKIHFKSVSKELLGVVFLELY